MDLKTGLSLIGNVLKLLAKSVLISLRLTAAASAIYAATYNKIFGSCCPLDLTLHRTTLVISNEEMNDIFKIVKSLEESGLLITGVCEKNKKNKKNKKSHFSACY